MASSPAEVFEALRQAHATADAEAAAALYAPDAVYYEPDNVPHRGRDEIRTYLASVYAVRGPVELSVKRQVGADQTVLAEWTSAYTEGGRRSTGVPGVSVVEVGRDGIVYHRDFGYPDVAREGKRTLTNCSVRAVHWTVPHRRGDGDGWSVAWTSLVVALLLAGVLARPRERSASSARRSPSEPTCDFTFNVDQAQDASGVTYGSAPCGATPRTSPSTTSRGSSGWTVEATPYRGFVVAVAWDTTGTYLLYVDASLNLRITKRQSNGVYIQGRLLSTNVRFDGSNAQGDVVATGGRWWAVWREHLAPGGGRATSSTRPTCSRPTPSAAPTCPGGGSPPIRAGTARPPSP